MFDSFTAGDLEEENECIASLEHGIYEIKQWMCENRIRMNDSKTEVIMFGYKIQSKKSETSGIIVGQEDI